MARPRRIYPSSPDVQAEEPVVSAIEVAQPAPVQAVTKVLSLVSTKTSLIEPHEGIWFHPGRPKEVARITKWMQAQIEAGLLQQV